MGHLILDKFAREHLHYSTLPVASSSESIPPMTFAHYRASSEFPEGACWKTSASGSFLYSFRYFSVSILSTIPLVGDAFPAQCPRDKQTAQRSLHLDGSTDTVDLSTNLSPILPDNVLRGSGHNLFFFLLQYFNDS
jgi:hypothetical protein